MESLLAVGKHGTKTFLMSFWILFILVSVTTYIFLATNYVYQIKNKLLPPGSIITSRKHSLTIWGIISTSPTELFFKSSAIYSETNVFNRFVILEETLFWCVTKKKFLCFLDNTKNVFGCLQLSSSNVLVL